MAAASLTELSVEEDLAASTLLVGAFAPLANTLEVMSLLVVGDDQEGRLAAVPLKGGAQRMQSAHRAAALRMLAALLDGAGAWARTMATTARLLDAAAA